MLGDEAHPEREYRALAPEKRAPSDLSDRSEGERNDKEVEKEVRADARELERAVDTA